MSFIVIVVFVLSLLLICDHLCLFHIFYYLISICICIDLLVHCSYPSVLYTWIFMIVSASCLINEKSISISISMQHEDE